MLSSASFLSVQVLGLVVVLCLGCVMAVGQKQLRINDGDVSLGEIGQDEKGRVGNQVAATSSAR